PSRLGVSPVPDPAPPPGGATNQPDDQERLTLKSPAPQGESVEALSRAEAHRHRGRTARSLALGRKDQDAGRRPAMRRSHHRSGDESSNAPSATAAHCLGGTGRHPPNRGNSVAGYEPPGERDRRRTASM